MPASASPEASLALRLVATAERRSACEGEIRALADRVDPARLIRLLRAQTLLPLAGSRLAGLGEPTSPELAAAVDADREAFRRRGSAQSMLGLRWATKLEAAGIPCLPLKGALLGQRIHGDLGLRGAGDVDLLVPAAQLGDAVEILRDDGFGTPADRTSANGLPEIHFRLDDPKGALPSVELHWRVHWYEESFSSELLQRSTFGEAGYRVARPADELASLLLFYARDGFVGLRLASDIAAWWDASGGDLSAGGLQPIADQHPELGFALPTAARVADRLVGLPSADLLDERPALRRRSRTAARLANWNLAGSHDRNVTNYHLVDWLLSPPGGGAAALRRQLLREPRPRTGLGRGIEQLRLVLRPPSRLLKSVAGLWSVRGGRCFSPPPYPLDD